MMKKESILTFFLISGLAAALLLSGCEGKQTEKPESSISRDASYAIGMAHGIDIKENYESGGIFLNYDEFLKGMKDSVTGNKTRFTVDEAAELLEKEFNSMTENRINNMIQNETSFLAENARKPGVIITPSGLQYEVIKEGFGGKPTLNDTVVVHYTGTLADGTIFDSSRGYGEPSRLALDRVIPGWREGLQLMSLGAHYIIYIPSNLGYGAEGITNPMTGRMIIPPYAVIIFDVELIDFFETEDEELY